MSVADKYKPASSSSDGPDCPGRPVFDRIETRTAVIGEGLTIRRALPGRGRRLVGAWCFLDHAGPRDYGHGQGLAVGPHPHIGLQTFTWMIEGEVMHRDSLGYEQVIRPGQVNLMTAGRGIAHAEDAVNDEPGRLHAAQLWIALPEGERHRAPAFAHHPELPALHSGGFRVTVLAGSAFGLDSPAEIFSPLVGLDLAATATASTTLELEPGFEHAALVLRGEANVAGEALSPGTLLYLGLGRGSLALACNGPAQVLLIGGAPLGENVLVWWNFVARSQEELEQATRDWNAGTRFGQVRGSPSAPLSAPDLAGLRLGKSPA
jgi:quercetin 2,3-dioxygenase